MPTLVNQLNKVSNSIHLNTQAGGFHKTSSTTDFATKLRTGVSRGASLAYQSVVPIAPMVPGGAVLSSLLNNTASNLGFDGGLGGVQGAGGPLGGGGSATFGGYAGLPGATMPSGFGMPGATGAGGGTMFESMGQLQQNMMSMNVYMLGLQQSFNEMNQKYTAASNILKTKHDTEKNAIQNFR